MNTDTSETGGIAQLRIKFVSTWKKIYREAAKYAKEIFSSWYLTEESLAFLRDLRAFAVPRF